MAPEYRHYGQCFNIREGLKPSEIKLPFRLVGIPPKSDGPLAVITIDMDSLTSEYCKAMGWDPINAYPRNSTIELLKLEDLTKT